MEELLSLASAASSVSPSGLIIIQRSTTYYEPASSLGAVFESFFGTGTDDGPSFLVTRYDDDGGSSSAFDRGQEAASPHDFECPCGEDVEALCDELKEGDDFYATIFETRLCLSRNRNGLSDGCAAQGSKRVRNSQL